MFYKAESFKFFFNRNKVQVFDYLKEGMILLGDHSREEEMVAEYEVISGNAKSSAISFDKLASEPSLIELDFADDFADIVAFTKHSKIGRYHFAQSKEILGELLEEYLSKNDNYNVGIIQMEGNSLLDAHKVGCFVQERIREEANVLLKVLYNETLGDTDQYHLWFF